MSKRFAPLPEPNPGGRFYNLAARLNGDIPLYGEGDYEAPRSGASSRLKAFRERPAGTSTAADKPKPSAPVSPPKPTTAELVAKAKADARAKVATVKASAAYAGRESTARNLLLNSSQSAADIVKTLTKSPTDAQLAAVDRHLKAKATDALWSKAYGIQNATNAPDSKPEGKYDAMWAKAYAQPKLARSTPE
jgi:hypothetical protein